MFWGLGDKLLGSLHSENPKASCFLSEDLPAIITRNKADGAYIDGGVFGYDMDVGRGFSTKRL